MALVLACVLLSAPAVAYREVQPMSTGSFGVDQYGESANKDCEKVKRVKN